ncbi:MAG: hypothetical protein P8R54_10325 [Myxococcota bacterium]|nr:hypothetical protein [Myxococcota bacterium]
MKWSGLLCALPAALSLVAVGLAVLLPEQTVWGYALAALLLSAPVWLMAAWPPWSLLVAWRTGERLVPGVCAVLGLLLMGQPLPAPEPGEGFLVVSANVNAFTGAPAAVEDALAQLGADVVLTYERRGAEIAGMVRVADDFDAQLARASHHAAAFCRLDTDCAGTVSAQLGSPTMAMPIVHVRLGGQLCVIGVHAPPPYPRDATGMTPYIAHLAAMIHAGRMRGDHGPCRDGDAAVLMGDMNAVPGSSPIRAMPLLGLTDALAGTGVFGASWPGGGDWPDLPVLRLDHAFVGAATVTGLHQVALPGSDHRALVGWFSPTD